MSILSKPQWKALNQMKNGCILCGDVGSGKSRTGIAYYFCKHCHGVIDGLENGYSEDYIPMQDPVDLYIITTAQKRDKKEWESELGLFLMSSNPDFSLYGKNISVVVDSWNNIKKYRKVSGSFFIFDEQRVVGSGVWVKSFLDISRKNGWVLLSATPGDTWLDYVPIFVANGFYKNRTEFKDRHVVYAPYTKYPKVERYIGEGHLMRLRKDILIKMEDQRETTRHTKVVPVEYDKIFFKDIMTRRFNPYTGKPIKNASEYGYTLRKIVNSDLSRPKAIKELCLKHPKAIIFYNFDYELEILKGIDYGCKIAEWNGHVHEPIPQSDKWVYLVQYAAGCEGWNCIETDTIIFYSLNHSYKMMHQASGRIDRMNTPFKDLFYYQLKSTSWIDLAISRALATKKDFNIRAYY